MLYLVDSIYLEISNKISEKDKEEFEKHFNNEIILKGAVYEKNGNVNYYEYKCNHDLLKKLRKEIKNFLDEENINIYSITISSSLSLYCNEKLKDEDIEKITKRFNLRLIEYSLECIGRYNYKFYVVK